MVYFPSLWNMVPVSIPMYNDIKELVEKGDNIYTIISHGHDDHIDDFFIKNYFNNSQIIISKFKSKGFFKKEFQISQKKIPIEIDRNFQILYKD